MSAIFQSLQSLDDLKEIKADIDVIYGMLKQNSDKISSLQEGYLLV